MRLTVLNAWHALLSQETRLASVLSAPVTYRMKALRGIVKTHGKLQLPNTVMASLLHAPEAAEPAAARALQTPAA